MLRAFVVTVRFTFSAINSNVYKLILLLCVLLICYHILVNKAVCVNAQVIETLA